jgi:hypothetical protein
VKHPVALFSLLVGFVVLSGACRAAEPVSPFSAARMNLVERNLVRSLASPISAIRFDAIQTVIALRRTAAPFDEGSYIIPLMRCMKSDDCPEVRIIAALALSEFNSHLARWSVERHAMYDSSARVAKHCEDFALASASATIAG